MLEPFVVINETPFYQGDWISDNRVEEKSTIVIDEVERVGDETFLHLSTQLTMGMSMSLGEFQDYVLAGDFVRIDRPKYFIGQLFRNRFTEKSMEIVDVPRIKNERDGEFHYYVLNFTPTFGYNHDVCKESEITNFYVTEGVDEI